MLFPALSGAELKSLGKKNSAQNCFIIDFAKLVMAIGNWSCFAFNKRSSK
jgi:hypothetical protein